MLWVVCMVVFIGCILYKSWSKETPTDEPVEDDIKVMEIVEFNDDYCVYADTETGVMYFAPYGRLKSGVSVMLNADGTPKL